MKRKTKPLDQFPVEWRPLAGLAPYGKNARVHGEEQIDRLAASLREFGWMRPLLITAAGEVIAGHGAMQAALRLGLSEAPCAIRDHLTPQQVKAYRIADNQLALLAGWDDRLLGCELQDLADAAARMLKPNRFAAFVVGDVRDRKGMYRAFPWETVRAFTDAGMRLYNEAVLITAVGSLPLRAGKAFVSSRKLGKTHQNVLIFVKGNPRLATNAVGPVEVADMESPDG